MDEITLDSYQITDNQKIGLKIKSGSIKGTGRWSDLNNYKDFSILKN